MRARNLSLVASASLRQLTASPAGFLLLVTRRFTPTRTLFTRVLSHKPAPAAQALAAFLADDPEQARTLLREHPPLSHDRMAGELAIALDEPRLAPGPIAASNELRARKLWNEGAVSDALDELPPRHPYARTLRGERDILLPGRRLVPPPSKPHTAKPGRVVHFLTNSRPHTSSGYARRSHAILRAQQDAGLEPLAVTRLGYPVMVGSLTASGRDVVDDIEYRRLIPWRLEASMPARLARQARALANIANEHGASVLHTTTHHQNALSVEAAAASLEIPWVYEVRGMLEKTWAAAKRTPEARAAAASSERYRLASAREIELACRADHVVTLSATMRAELVARGVPEERITVIPNSVDASLLRESEVCPPSARTRLGLPRKGLWVGAVSSLVDYEGFDVLLEAVAQLRASGHDVRALIGGHGAAAVPLERRAAELGLTDAGAAHFPGKLTHADAIQYLHALDVVTVPRLDLPVTRSVTPLKPVEAMALGRSVVLSDIPALAELARDEHGAQLATLAAPGNPASLAEAIIRAAQPNDTRCTAAHAFAAERTWQRAGERYAELYARLA